jgi:hypothetical protein
VLAPRSAAASVGTLAFSGIAMASPPVRTMLAAHVSNAHARPARAVSFTIPARAGRYSLSAGGDRALIVRNATDSPMTTITCTLSVTDPYYFTNVDYGPAVAGSAEVQCTGTVSEIYVGAGIYYEGTLEYSSYVEDNNVSTVTANTACQYHAAGYYETGGVATIEFPSGYSPSSENLGEIYSPEVYIYHTT